MTKDYNAFFRQHLQRDATVEDQIRILEHLFDQPITTQTRQLVRVDAPGDLTSLFNKGAGLEMPQENIEEAILAIKREESKNHLKQQQQKEKRSNNRKIGSLMVAAGFLAMVSGAVSYAYQKGFSSANKPLGAETSLTPLEELHAKDSYIPLEDLLSRTAYFWIKNEDLNRITKSAVLMPDDVSDLQRKNDWLEGGWSEVTSIGLNSDGTYTGTSYSRSISYYKNADKKRLDSLAMLEASRILADPSGVAILHLAPQPDIEKNGVKCRAYKVSYYFADKDALETRADNRFIEKDDIRKYRTLHEAYAIATVHEDLFQLFLVKGDALDYSSLESWVDWENGVFDLILDH